LSQRRRLVKYMLFRRCISSRYGCIKARTLRQKASVSTRPHGKDIPICPPQYVGGSPLRPLQSHDSSRPSLSVRSDFLTFSSTCWWRETLPDSRPEQSSVSSPAERSLDAALFFCCPFLVSMPLRKSRAFPPCRLSLSFLLLA